MKKKNLWERIVRKIPIIKTYALALDEKEHLKEQTDLYLARKARAHSELERKTESLSKELEDAKRDIEELEKGRERDRTEILTLNKNMADKHAELRKAEEHAANLEKTVEKARTGFDLFEKFKQRTIKEYWELNAKHEQAKATVKNLKHRTKAIMEVARTYKFEANKFAIEMLASTLENAGISALLFDEEEIIYATSSVPEKIEIEEDVAGMRFTDLFEGESIEAFSTMGPQYPLTAKDPRKEFAGIMFEFMMGHDPETKKLKQYRAIWLIDDRKIGLSGYFRGQVVAMPRNITQVFAKTAVGRHLNANIGRSGQKLVLECNSATNIDPDAAEYLTKASENEACKLIIRHPNTRIYNMLKTAGFPEKNIKAYSPKETSPQVHTLVFGLGHA